jgi:hypothetical protein
VNVAVARALHAAAAGVRGKAGQRRLIARDSQYLAGLVRAVPGASRLPAPVTATAAVPPSRAALGWAALVAWLVTAGLGMSLVFLGPARDAATAPDITGLSTAELSTGGQAARWPGALVIAAHIAAASITILLTVLAAIGSG